VALIIGFGRTRVMLQPLSEPSKGWRSGLFGWAAFSFAYPRANNGENQNPLRKSLTNHLGVWGQSPRQVVIIARMRTTAALGRFPGLSG